MKTRTTLALCATALISSMIMGCSSIESQIPGKYAREAFVGKYATPIGDTLMLEVNMTIDFDDNKTFESDQTMRYTLFSPTESNAKFTALYDVETKGTWSVDGKILTYQTDPAQTKVEFEADQSTPPTGDSLTNAAFQMINKMMDAQNETDAPISAEVLSIDKSTIKFRDPSGVEYSYAKIEE